MKRPIMDEDDAARVDREALEIRIRDLELALATLIAAHDETRDVRDTARQKAMRALGFGGLSGVVAGQLIRSIMTGGAK